MKNFNLKSLKRQGGATLLEQMLWLLGTLAIVAFIIFMKNMVIPMVNGWRAGSTISSVANRVNSSYNGANSYAGLTTATVAVRSIFDDKFLNAGTITNLFGGQITFSVATINTPNDTQQITDNGIPRRSCETYVNQVASDLDRISVGGVIVKAVAAPINTSTLITQCNSADLLVIFSEKIKQS